MQRLAGSGTVLRLGAALDAACGPGGVRRALLVSSEAAGGVSASASAGGVPRRYAGEAVARALQAQGWLVMSLTLRRAVAAGADPQLESVAAGVAMCQRTGAQAVVAVGGGQALHVGKAVARVALCASASRLRELFGCVQGATVVREPPWLPRERLPFCAVPALPAGGAEVGSACRVMDWDKEERLFLGGDDALAAPQLLCHDWELMLQDNDKALPASAVAFALGQCIALAQAGQLPAGLAAARGVGAARRAALAHDAPAAFEALAAACLELGGGGGAAAALAPAPRAPHLAAALALCDLVPLDLEHTAAAMLGAAPRLWSTDEARAADRVLLAAGMDRAALAALSTDVGTVQLVHNLALDTTAQLKVAAATAALWAGKDAALVESAMRAALLI